ncbi:MAG: hypothetical protein HY675_00340 [Chloroflexi bacterium]|nr:hypothetical protein [Chloroflexota bacterium]
MAVSKSDHSLTLRDLLSEREDVKLTDVGFSQTAIVGSLLFLRVVPFDDFNMTSGIAFVFPDDLESYLLRKYKKLAKKVPSESDSTKRFVSFSDWIRPMA